MNNTIDAQTYRGALTTRRVIEITGLLGHIIRQAIRLGRLSAICPPVRAWRTPEAALRQWLATGATPQNEGK